MKALLSIVWLAAALLFYTGCDNSASPPSNPGDPPPADTGDPDTREMGREVGETSREIGREVTKFGREVAGEAKEFGRGVKEGLNQGETESPAPE